MSIGLLIAAAACAYIAGERSGDELAGAYRHGEEEMLRVLGSSFLAEQPPGAARASTLQSRTAALRRLDPQLAHASVWGRRDGRLVRLSSTEPAEIGQPVPEPDARRAMPGREVHAEVREGGRHLAKLLLPLPGSRGETLELARDLGPHDEALASRTRRMALILTALLLAFTAFTALLLGRRVFRRVHRLRVATQRIEAGQLDTRLGWRRRDELGLLAHDFDAMARELEQQHDQLEALAHEDALTGLANHRRFQEFLSDRVERAQRDGTSLALVILDIDHFKRLNDARGHPFGDQALRTVGARLAATMRDLGFVARLGGDEFALVLQHADGPRAYALAGAARAAIEGLDFDGYELSCSAGVACYPEDTRDGATLVQLADGALYWAKRSGRARIRRYDPEHVLVVTDEQRAAFAHVLETPNVIRPAFQPIVALASGRICGYEALARFVGTDNRPPAWWFAQAHRFGLGTSLESEAVRAALAAGAPPDGTFISINVSPSALLAAELRDALPENLTRFVIEITEHEQIGDHRALQAVLRPLRDRGARIAVDDAGAGYAGLQQVMRLGADVIKLDRALVEGVHADRAKRALVESFVTFAASTDAEVCAEGIETLEELRVLVELGVTYGQGYVLARPSPPWADVDPRATQVCIDGVERGERRVLSLAERRQRAVPV